MFWTGNIFCFIYIFTNLNLQTVIFSPPRTWTCNHLYDILHELCTAVYCLFNTIMEDLGAFSQLRGGREHLGRSRRRQCGSTGNPIQNYFRALGQKLTILLRKCHRPSHPFCILCSCWLITGIVTHILYYSSRITDEWK